MPEWTADLRRVVDLVRERGGEWRGLTVLGHPCPWRDDLAEVLGERLPEVTVGLGESPADDGSVTVWLEVEESEARFQNLEQEWETSGRKGRGEPMVPGATWVPASRMPEREPEPESEPMPDVDIVFVPVSGVRPPRRISFSWGDPAELLWDEDNTFIGDELADVLPLPAELRGELKAWKTGSWTSEPRDLVVRLREALGPDFDVRT